MAPKNRGKRWTAGQKALVKKLAKGNTPTGVIGLKLGRTKKAIYAQAAKLKVSLKPTNQSPYNRRKKG
jgi:LPS sulfotransferase NodH